MQIRYSNGVEWLERRGKCWLFFGGRFSWLVDYFGDGGGGGWLLLRSAEYSGS